MKKLKTVGRALLIGVSGLMIALIMSTLIPGTNFLEIHLFGNDIIRNILNFVFLATIWFACVSNLLHLIKKASKIKRVITELAEYCWNAWLLLFLFSIAFTNWPWPNGKAAGEIMSLGKVSIINPFSKVSSPLGYFFMAVVLVCFLLIIALTIDMLVAEIRLAYDMLVAEIRLAYWTIQLRKTEKELEKAKEKLEKAEMEVEIARLLRKIDQGNLN